MKPIQSLRHRIRATHHDIRYLVPPTARERAAIDRLRQSIAALPPVAAGSDVWRKVRVRIRERILDSDPRRFLRWPEIIWHIETGPADFVYEELAELQFADGGWLKAAYVDRLGVPNRLPEFPRASPLSLHHVYHFYRFATATGLSVRDFRQIIEVGAGYGAMTRAAWRLGFRGQHILFDFPEFQALQDFYLGQLGHRATFTASASDIPPLMGGSRSLLIATWSLSEMPLNERAQIVDIATRCDGVLLAYQSEWAGIDNRAYFQSVIERIPVLEWSTVPSPHSDSRYLFGHRSVERSS